MEPTTRDALIVAALAYGDTLPVTPFHRKEGLESDLLNTVHALMRVLEHDDNLNHWPIVRIKLGCLAEWYRNASDATYDGDESASASQLNALKEVYDAYRREGGPTHYPGYI